MPKKLHYQEIEKTFDSDGNMTEHTNLKIVKVEQEPAYVKLYLRDLSRIQNLPGRPEHIIFQLILAMDYDGEITINKRLKKKIADNLGLSEGRVANVVSILLKKEIIKKIDRTTYMMNPDLFAKGSWRDITKLRSKFELVVSYDSDGKRKVTGKEVK